MARWQGNRLAWPRRWALSWASCSPRRRRPRSPRATSRTGSYFQNTPGGDARPARGRVLPGVGSAPAVPCTIDERATVAAATIAWDTIAGSSTFTTDGEYADTALSALNPIAPGPDRNFRPVSVTRDYLYSFTNQWRTSSCDPAVFSEHRRVGRQANDINAATVNVFVAHNHMHDWSRGLGFTPATFNMEGADPMLGNVQAGAKTGPPTFTGRDAANLATPADGTSPSQHLVPVAADRRRLLPAVRGRLLRHVACSRTNTRTRSPTGWWAGPRRSHEHARRAGARDRRGLRGLRGGRVPPRPRICARRRRGSLHDRRLHHRQRRARRSKLLHGRQPAELLERAGLGRQGRRQPGRRRRDLGGGEPRHPGGARRRHTRPTAAGAGSGSRSTPC